MPVRGFAREVRFETKKVHVHGQEGRRTNYFFYAKLEPESLEPSRALKANSDLKVFFIFRVARGTSILEAS
jgi:hypothetical protein